MQVILDEAVSHVMQYVYSHEIMCSKGLRKVLAQAETYSEPKIDLTKINFDQTNGWGKIDSLRPIENGFMSWRCPDLY